MATRRDALTAKQQEILEVIRRCLMRSGQAPTVREIGKEVGLRSSCSVQKHLEKLEANGYIRKDQYKYRSIELIHNGEPMTRRRTVTVPLLGVVGASFERTMADNDENVIDNIPLPESLVPRDADCFMLEVRGDSMINAGIYDHDLIVVRKQETANNGDIVVALLDNQTTVKRFFNDGDDRGIRLQPENPEHTPIISPDVQILGRVVLTMRQYA